MTITNNKNEQIKRCFFDYLKGAKGFTEDTLHSFASAISQYQTFSQHADFGSFDKSMAVAFVEHLENRTSKTTTGKLSVITRANYLRRVKQFFTWLSKQPGYKSAIIKNDLDYLRLSKKDAQTVRYGTTKKPPTLDEVKKIIHAIMIKSDTDRRDRALISLALISGMRIAAMTSLKMKSFDPAERKIDQNPADAVKTKNSKRILTTFFRIGWEEPERYFLEWYDYLKSIGFGPDHPIFPATMSSFGEKGFEGGKNSVGKECWSATGAARGIFKKRCLDANVPYFNPHLFRHLLVSIMAKIPLTEEQKRAISVTLGHANVGTTFGTHAYGKISNEDALKIIPTIGANVAQNMDGSQFSAEDKVVLLKGAQLDTRTVNSLTRAGPNGRCRVLLPRR